MITGRKPVALGIDIGGTKIAAALVDERGSVLARERGPVAPESNDAGLKSVCRVVDRLLDAAPSARGQLAGIGAGCPGSIDWRAGVVRGAANLAWRDLPLAERLATRYGVPTLLDNDVNVAAWGERSFDQSRPIVNGEDPVRLDHLVFITVGTGIGAGLIEAGRIVRGRQSAGEVGHIPIVEQGPRCPCGMVGCLEALAAGPALGAAGRALAEREGAPRLIELAGGRAAAIAAPHVIQAAAEGDAGARRLLDREGYYLALAVLIVSRMLDPQVVVMGGGLAEAGPPLFESIWTNLARLRPRGPCPQHFVVPARRGAAAGAIGAAALVLRPEPGFVGTGLIAPRP